MQEAWITLECPDCSETWEADPSDLPAPGKPFTCRHCGQTSSVSEFPKTQRGFEVLAAAHEGT